MEISKNFLININFLLIYITLSIHYIISSIHAAVIKSY